ncbi:hypothetical protein BS17DRAFT_817502 [Gyrodon lividus]|nr:hypothetical protein BS17DRAFT_817502 [Gyrodon lividus]
MALRESIWGTWPGPRLGDDIQDDQSSIISSMPILIITTTNSKRTESKGHLPRTEGPPEQLKRDPFSPTTNPLATPSTEMFKSHLLTALLCALASAVSAVPVSTPGYVEVAKEPGISTAALMALTPANLRTLGPPPSHIKRAPGEPGSDSIDKVR